MIRVFLETLRRDTRGATAMEYGLIVALIALGAMTAFSQLGNANANGLNGSLAKLTAAIDAVT